MGIPVSSTGPIPENLMSLSSLFVVQLPGKLEFWTPLDRPPELQSQKQDFIVPVAFIYEFSEIVKLFF